MAKKIAFVYAHGGPVFDKNTADGLNERGRNLVRSIISALASGADKVFISESVYHGNESQVHNLMKKGFFRGIESKINLVAYPIAKNVKFPKNYLMNRAAQKANGYVGLIFSDSDVLYKNDFVNRVEKVLNNYDFLQPEKIMYLSQDGRETNAIVKSTMRALNSMNNLVKKNLWYLEGMPGMVNITNRNKFLEIGGFSQAISGVNFEDIEYILRLRILGEGLSYLPNEICCHLYHSRSAITRKSEKLVSMYFENANFMNWFISHYLKIQGTKYDKRNFDEYMRLIKESLNSNNRLRGPYKNETGTIIHEFDQSKKYHGIYFGTEEPYVEQGTKKEKIMAIRNAASFWKISFDEIMERNPEWKYAGVRIEDLGKETKEEEIYKETEEVVSQINNFCDYAEDIFNEIDDVLDNIDDYSGEDQEALRSDIDEILKVIDNLFSYYENRVDELINKIESTS